ncbi:hypothetical protein A1A1_15049 [Planococcus antarcticus DSM 14505]|uniref:Uncharacterized protein n=1 Tax=Planococcus antarcticus DSM 14505 TaxID=1185653 RepID=A0AA87IJL5_9BACL|nr:hypothetical protein [Planococcus antarcticus]EIM05644.1 hypothetical protein A1A1_15049 [Planococcus antarcticus DSM 14505]
MQKLRNPMDLERINKGVVEIQRIDAMSALWEQSVCNSKITEAHDAHQLAGFIAVAVYRNL